MQNVINENLTVAHIIADIKRISCLEKFLALRIHAIIANIRMSAANKFKIIAII